MTEIVEVTRGSAGLLVSIPHTGTIVPPEVERDLASVWLASKDVDWHIERLYDFVVEFDATIVRATHSRTVIDVNRDPSGASLYPGQGTTGLCPTETFDGEPLYKQGRAPEPSEINRRRRLYFEPYHAALTQEIARLEQKHLSVVLYDCHSIRSVIPRLFEGELPDMNIGTNSGASCDAALAHVIEGACDLSGFSWVTNGRFRGGWITRHYGRPANGVHAIQMELSCRAYLDEPIPSVDETTWPPAYNETRAAKIRTTLKAIFEACAGFVKQA